MPIRCIMRQQDAATELLLPKTKVLLNIQCRHTLFDDQNEYAANLIMQKGQNRNEV